MPSSHYLDLKQSIRTLRSHLLPRQFDSSGNYTERVFTKVVAFRVLSHAAIEEYIEERVVEIAIESSKTCKYFGRIPHPTACLLSFSEASGKLPPDTLLPPNPNHSSAWPEKIDVFTRISKVTSFYVRFVKSENHGVREKNIISLLIPIGYPHQNLDPYLVSELDNFGKLRGEFAHTGVSKHVQSKPNPELELKKVTEIVNLLKNVDKELDSILSICS
ncbi:hypothetical protein ACSSVZ_005080 [Amorphus sp. MBR-141]